MSLTRRFMSSWMVLLPWVSKLANANITEVQIAPCKFPFDASKAGNALNVNFEIKKLEPWIFALQTDYTAENKQKVIKLAAGELNVTDLSITKIEIPIRIKIYSETGNLLIEKIIKTTNSYKQGFYSEKNTGHFHRLILKEKLQPGQYNLQVEMLKDTFEIENIKTFIAIELQYIK